MTNPRVRKARKRKTAKRPAESGTKLVKKKLKCDICSKIVEVFKSPMPTDHFIELGKYEEVMMSSSCKAHPPFFQQCLSLNGGGRSNLSDAQLKIGRIGGQYKASYFVIARNSDTVLVICNLMLLSTSAGPAYQRARSTNQYWIDKSLLFRWKQSCDSQNRENCQHGIEITRYSLARPCWLIDTWRLCLVPGNTGTSYVALSYVWGKNSFFTNSKETLCQLQSDFSLLNAVQKLGVPRIIADAIAVVGLLKERYLWVDSLCIVQNDEKTKHAEIKNMAYIYSGATVTIIAAQGNDANYGLRGLQNISKPRRRPRDVFKPGRGYEIVEAVVEPWPSGDQPMWHKRGWTFQEQLFSRRHLIFENDSIKWQCGCSVFQEDIEAQPGSRDVNFGADSQFNMSFPSLEAYMTLVNNYNLRDFTYSKDALAAFSGITAALSRRFKGGFLCGLPLMYLDVALCWQPIQECQRRTPVATEGSFKFGLPSWSWVGWKCHLDVFSWNSGSSFMKLSSQFLSDCSNQTLSITQWFSRKWGSLNYHPVDKPQNAVMQWRTRGLQGKPDDFPGWKKFDFSPPGLADGVINWMDPQSARMWLVNGKPLQFYKHENDPYSEFWYPIPMVDESEHQPPVYQDDDLLCCHTQRAWFGLKGRILDRHNSNKHFTLSIRDAQGSWAGALTLNSDKYMNHEECELVGELGCSQDVPYELVAISKGYAIGFGNEYDDSMPEWYISERPQTPFGEKYWYYNVLWVEWKDGIAYRKGCGRVMESAWEAQDREWIDLVLG